MNVRLYFFNDHQNFFKNICVIFYWKFPKILKIKTVIISTLYFRKINVFVSIVTELVYTNLFLVFVHDDSMFRVE